MISSWNQNMRGSCDLGMTMSKSCEFASKMIMLQTMKTAQNLLVLAEIWTSDKNPSILQETKTCEVAAI